MTAVERVFTHIMTRYRSLVMIVLALPLSCLWDLALWLRQHFVFYMRSAPKLHPQRVAAVVQQVKARPPGMRMCTGRPGWQSMSLSYRSYKSTSHCVTAICDMIDIVSIDTDAAVPTITVEPLVTCGQLTRMLLPLGFTLPVVPEMDDLTIGGLVNGTGIESSSHVHGLFHEQCVAFEVCLADGTVVCATKDEHADVFEALPWSYGTLGILLSVKMRIVRCKPFVKLTYFPYKDSAAALDHFARLSSAGDAAPAFVETLAFSLNEYVVMTGEEVDKPDPTNGETNTISWWWKPWFFKHVQSKLSDGAPSTEYLLLRDYYHRHTRSMFWEMEMMLPIGNQPLCRLLFGWALPPKVSFLKLTQSELTRRLTQETHVAQDFLVPMDSLGHVMELCDTVFEQIYPVWLCPHVHRSMRHTVVPDPPNPGADGSQMYVDVGVYGLPSSVRAGPQSHPSFNMRVAMRLLEAHLREIGGVQMLYADIFQMKEEFEQMFPHAEYRAIREKYGAVGTFPEIYDKMHVLHGIDGRH